MEKGPRAFPVSCGTDESFAVSPKPVSSSTASVTFPMAPKKGRDSYPLLRPYMMSDILSLMPLGMTSTPARCGVLSMISLIRAIAPSSSHSSRGIWITSAVLLSIYVTDKVTALAR